MHSCIYEGQVRHRRFQPAVHDFHYRLYMMYLDLDELPSVFKCFWLWSVDRPNLAFFDRRKHYGDPQRALHECVRDLVQDKTGQRPAGPIRLLTHLRYFGYGFNPVSFYYCFDEQDENLECIVAEVNNTPWGEQHCYVLDEASNHGGLRKKRYQFDKHFHVSPFMEMNLSYDWHFSAPQKQLMVHMRNLKDDERIFDATMVLKSRPISSATLTRVLLQYPLMTARVIIAIHYQALRLWLKKVPFYTHPDKKEAPPTAKEI